MQESKPSSRIRPWISWIVSTVGVAAIVVSVLLSYASMVLFDGNAFADRAAQSLSDPDVAALVSDRVTTGIVAEYRDLTPYRPLVLGATQAIVTSDAFRGIVRRAAVLAHGAMLSEPGQEVILTVSDVGVVLKSALAASPELADRVPDQITSVLGSSGELPLNTAAVELMSFAGRFSSLTDIVMFSGIALVLLGMLISVRRRVAMLRLGLALAVIAFVLLLLVRLGGGIIAGLIDEPLVAGAVAGLWKVFFGGFTLWAFAMCGVGVVLAAGATALLERIRLDAMGRAAWRWVVSPPGGRVANGLRGVLLVAAGFVLVLYPTQLLAVLASLSGIVVIFLGLREIFRLVLGGLPTTWARTAAGGVPTSARASAAGAAASSGEGRPSRGRVVIVAALVAAIIIVSMIAFRRSPATSVVPRPIETCNGHPELCDRRLNEVVFPATHNSMGASDIPDWMFPNQESGILRQLNDGIRGLLIDVHYGIPVGDKVKTVLDDEATARRAYEEVLGKEGVDAAMRIRDRLVGGDEAARGVYLCHGFCELGASPFVRMLREIREFLILNPHEVLVVVIQDEDVTPQDVAAAFKESRLTDFIYHGGVTPPWPTLREMVERDGRVLVMAENESEGVSWIHPAFEVMQETPYRFHDPSEFSCKPNRGGTAGSLLLMNHWIETAPAPRPSNAEVVNAYDFLLARARRCEKERGMLPNLIAVDFYRTGDVVGVARTLNGIGEGAEAASDSL